jgi:hypothetical protein
MRARPILSSRLRRSPLALFLLVGPSMAGQSPERALVQDEELPARVDVQRLRSRFAADRTAFGGIDAVAFDDLGNGAIWVRGRNYKARVDSRGLTYVPFLGSCAPRNYPVSFALRSASIGGADLAIASDSPPIRDGQRIWLEHGSVTEILDVSLDSIEQTFVVHRGAGTGELQVDLDVDSELPLEVDGAGAWFRTPYGAVQYSRARTFDAGGRELATSSRPSGRSIEFTVAASDVARASGELTIDPIITTVTLDSSDNDDRFPDVAYDVSNDRYIVVFERIYSQSDHDIYCQMVDGATGQPIANTWSYIDFTWEDWRHPSVANMNNIDKFLVAASVGPEPRVIKCRARSAGSTAMGTPFTLDHTAAGSPCDNHPYDYFSDVAPVVGGDTWPGNGANFCCVAWVRNKVMIGSWGIDACPDIVFCTVTQSGMATSTQFLEHNYENFRGTAALLDGSFAMLSISKSNGDSFSGGSQDWNLAWQYWDTSAIHGAQIHWTGTVTHPVTMLVSAYLSPPGLNPWRAYSAISVSSPVSNPTREFLITFDALGPSGAPRLYGALVNPWGLVPTSRIFDLTTLQEAGQTTYTQWHPSVDCDGTSYVVAFNAYPGGYLGLGAAQFGWWYSRWSGLSFTVLEAQVQIAQDANAEMGAHVCAEASGGGSRRNTLIGSQHWRGSSPPTGGVGGDPFVALFAH